MFLSKWEIVLTSLCFVECPGWMPPTEGQCPMLPHLKQAGWVSDFWVRRDVSCQYDTAGHSGGIRGQYFSRRQTASLVASLSASGRLDHLGRVTMLCEKRCWHGHDRDMNHTGLTVAGHIPYTTGATVMFDSSACDHFFDGHALCRRHGGQENVEKMIMGRGNGIGSVIYLSDRSDR